MQGYLACEGSSFGLLCSASCALYIGVGAKLEDVCSPRSTMQDSVPITVWCPTDSSPQFTWINSTSYFTINESSKHLENFCQMFCIQKVVRIWGKVWLTHWACLTHWLTANMLVKCSLVLFCLAIVLSTS